MKLLCRFFKSTSLTGGLIQNGKAAGQGHGEVRQPRRDGSSLLVTRAGHLVTTEQQAPWRSLLCQVRAEKEALAHVE